MILVAGEEEAEMFEGGKGETVHGDLIGDNLDGKGDGRWGGELTTAGERAQLGGAGEREGVGEA